MYVNKAVSGRNPHTQVSTYIGEKPSSGANPTTSEFTYNFIASVVVGKSVFLKQEKIFLL
jgi:hypothetical protein